MCLYVSEGTTCTCTYMYSYLITFCCTTDDVGIVFGPGEGLNTPTFRPATFPSLSLRGLGLA